MIVMMSMKIENISNSSAGTLNEASSKTIITLRSSDVSEEIFKTQSPEVITDTSEAKSSKVSIKVCEVNFFYYMFVLSWLIDI